MATKATATVHLPAGTTHYELIWADEFDIDGAPDPARWTFEHGFVRNQELQWYQPDNARCEGGVLKITGRREQVANPRYDADSRDWRRNRPGSHPDGRPAV